MNFTNVQNDADVWELMTEPTPVLVDVVRTFSEDVLVLGGSGKMGKELIGMLQMADREAGFERRISVASTFSNPSDLKDLSDLGVDCLQGDLSSPAFLASLPDAPNVFYMMGFKFGSSKDWRRAFHLNSIVPYQVGDRYRNSRIVVFSSGNPYPHSRIDGKGCAEDAELDPMGVYGWSIVARESSFATTAMMSSAQKLTLFRLMYAQHFCYGVLADLADLVKRNMPVSLAMPAVNLVSQRDANHAALCALRYCDNPAWLLNVAGPVYPVRRIVEDLASVMNTKPVFADEESETALLADDSLCLKTIGPYRDSYEDMLTGIAKWVSGNGTNWNKPTYFGSVQHKY